jgi:hypothetical protein
MDKLLSTHPQVYVVMGAKSAGKAVKRFTLYCTGENPRVGFGKIMSTHDGNLKEAFSETLEQPSLIASHLSVIDKPFVQLVKHATADSLILYVHREEHERMRSAIRQVASLAICKGEDCIIPEQDLIKAIEKQEFEIGRGATQTLTCDTYSTIEENAPNLVFLDYKQVDRVLGLLAKHHCPGNEAALQAIGAHTGHEKPSVAVQIPSTAITTTTTTLTMRKESKIKPEINTENGTNDETETETNDETVYVDQEDWLDANETGTDDETVYVDLEDWLDAKMGLMEYALRLKQKVSCQARTRKIEHDLGRCGDETLHFSSSHFFA